jgi:hypothetical protein
MFDSLKDIARQRPWLPDHGAMLLREQFDRHRNLRAGWSDAEHLSAAAAWICAAQDAQSDGGISGRYRLDRGWTSSYPETTGYLIPTLLALDAALPGAGFAARAARAVAFLLGTQLADGAFPALEIAENRTQPSPFNTAQILHGLTAWHRASGDETTRAAAERAAEWLLGAQDPDGAFRRHTYNNKVTTYSAHLTCWLAEWGVHAGDQAALDAAGRHLDWVLGHVRPNGWIDLMGFDQQQHAADEAFTHTIAYTIWGMLMTSELLGREDGIAAADRAAECMLRLTERERRLPGLVSNWKRRHAAACLTGNAQMALIWFRLHRRTPNLRYVNVALKAIDLVKAAQPMQGRNPGIVGGIPGSDPVDGPYIANALPNWAAKFFIDAVLEKRAILAGLEKQAVPAGLESQAIPAGAGAATADEPAPLPAPAVAPALHTVLIASEGSSRKVAAMLAAFGTMDLGRVTIVVERTTEPPALRRIRVRLRDDGLSWVVQRLRLQFRRAGSRAAGPFWRRPQAARPPGDVRAFGLSHGIDVVETARLDGADAIAAVARLAPDLGIHAGGPILRPALIDCFRLGVLNAHMGLIPAYRGMNVAEWAALEGGAVGCSVHLIDRGIDTGPVLARQVVDISGCRSVGELRARVDQAQLALLARVLRSVLQTGAVPAALELQEKPGPQYFRMHPDLVALLERRLASA